MYVNIVNIDVSRIRLIHAAKQIYKRRFARACRAHYGDSLTGAYFKTDVIEYIFVFKGKRNLIKLNSTFYTVIGIMTVIAVGNKRTFIENLHNLICRGKEAL